jgi:hypothetical protein
MVDFLKEVWSVAFKGRSAAWTAIFTGVLTLFTLKMYQVSRITSETSRASERAFLSFSGAGLGARIIGADGVWTHYEISLNWSNSGSTPAKSGVIQNNI